MRIGLVALLLVFSSMAAEASCSCLTSTIADDFVRSSAVFEATAESVDRASGKARVRVKKAWKTDGGDLTVVYSGFECDFPLLTKGKSYVLFAERSQSFWSFLPWVKEPLWVSLCSPSVPLEPVEFIDYYRSKTASVRQYLDGAKP